ncbi:DJ-1/PfpI family protein [bacterium]|nr:DJ-1/PfpI family protein [bacterium]
MTTIGILLFDGTEELDAVGPWEVLSAWSAGWPDDGVAVTLIGLTEGPITCAKGMRVLPDITVDEAPPLDIVIVPGGRGTQPLVGDERMRALLGTWARSGTLMTSVCTGSLLLADAGLLTGRPATTHWGALDHLTAIDPTIEVRPDDRFVDDGPIVTASGVSAGIDMALHLVVRFAGVERAKEVRRYIQYDPRPPI